MNFNFKQNQSPGFLESKPQKPIWIKLPLMIEIDRDEIN